MQKRLKMKYSTSVECRRTFCYSNNLLLHFSDTLENFVLRHTIFSSWIRLNFCHKSSHIIDVTNTETEKCFKNPQTMNYSQNPINSSSKIIVCELKIDVLTCSSLVSKVSLDHTVVWCRYSCFHYCFLYFRCRFCSSQFVHSYSFLGHWTCLFRCCNRNLRNIV